MKRIFLNKKGVTLLESLIALMLLAIVATGTFGVLLSVTRTSATPDIREEMTMAIEKADEKLRAAYADYLAGNDSMKGLCYDPNDPSSSIDNNPWEGTNHNINCLLPDICDMAHSSFFYTAGQGLSFTRTGADGGTGDDYQPEPEASITYSIECNGFKL